MLRKSLSREKGVIETKIYSMRRGNYRFAKNRPYRITPSPMYAEMKVLDATPQFIRRFVLNDEQALLAVLRYNRLVDIFLGLTCYSLQSSFRTTLPGMGQTETDEIYIGINREWRPFVIPVHVQGRGKRIGTMQIEQDMAVCEAKFPALVCRPVAAQFVESDLIVLFEFERIKGVLSIREERHYRIVPNEMLSDEEIKAYGKVQ